jgi:hypothetical protein
MATTPSKCSKDVNDIAAAPHTKHLARLDLLPTELRLQIFSHFLPANSILCEVRTAQFHFGDDQTRSAFHETVTIQLVCRLFHNEMKGRLQFRLEIRRWSSVLNFQAQFPGLASDAINSLMVECTISQDGLVKALAALRHWKALGSVTYLKYRITNGRPRRNKCVRKDLLQVLEDLEVEKTLIAQMGFK